MPDEDLSPIRARIREARDGLAQARSARARWHLGNGADHPATLAQAEEEGQRRLLDLAAAMEELAARDLSAPGLVPLLLLPLRIETRFSDDERRLRIRVHPDDVHLDALDRGLTPEEAEAGRAYWLAPSEGADAAWAGLCRAVGKPRAPWVAQAMKPVLDAGAPRFPEPLHPQGDLGRFRLLPDRFHAAAWQAGTVSRGYGKPIAEDPPIGILARGEPAHVEEDGLGLVPGTEWLVRFDAAQERGLAFEMTLDGAGPVDRLLVYGVSSAQEPEAAARAFEALLLGHRATRGLGFVPQGTPTNNTEAQPSGWERRQEPPRPTTVPDALPPDSNAAVLAGALGFGADWLGELDHGLRREQAVGRAVGEALWPATWGYFLDALDQTSSGLSAAVVDEARAFHATHLRGRGPLPALRLGDQPYGILPVTLPEVIAATDGALPGRLAALLGRLRPAWAQGAATLPRVGTPGPDGRLPDWMGLQPHSYGLRARQCLSAGALNLIATATGADDDASATESLIVRLLAEALGGYSSIFGAGSLAQEALPVPLPLADPARDAAVLGAILDTGAPGAISSVVQALAAVSWTLTAPDPPPRFEELVRETSLFPVERRERIVTLLEAGPGADIAEIEAEIAALPGVAPAGQMPSLRSLQVTQGGRSALAETALQIASPEIRDQIGVTVVDGMFRETRRRQDLAAALSTLRELDAAGEGDLTQAVAEAIDTASHRYDAWVTALADHRLAALRAGGGQGLTLGAYGWAEDLRPRVRPDPAGGCLLAPSPPQAVTAALLRSAFVTHGGGAAAPFATDLSSRRVREARALLDGMRQGQPLGALLGYGIERRLQDAGCERFVLSLRELAPLDRSEGPGDDVEAPSVQALAAGDVVDGLAIARLWQAPGGLETIQDKVRRAPDRNVFLDPHAPWDLSGAQWDSISAAIEAAVAEADAAADLMLAEAVHQMASGNPRRAGVALDASGRGEVAPPEPEVIAQPSAGPVLEHRLLALLPGEGGWSATAPRAQAAPRLEAWAAGRLGDPAGIRLQPGLTLAEASLAALDLVHLAAEPVALDRLLRARLGDRFVGPPLPSGDPALGPGEVALADALLLGRALADLLALARPADELTLALPGHAGWRLADGALAEALDRLTAVLEEKLDPLREQLRGLLGAAGVPAPPGLDTALAGLIEFGILPPGRTPGPGLAVLALAEADRRAEAARALLRAGPDGPDRIDALAKAIFGREALVPLPWAFDAALAPEGATTGRRAIAPPAPGLLDRVVADWAAIRPAVTAWSKAHLLGVALGTPPDLGVAQLVGPGTMEHGTWLGGDLDPGLPSPTAAVVSLLTDRAEGPDLDAPVWALLLDHWTEILPERVRRGQGEAATVEARASVAVAVHADSPGSEPPQAWLLAASPDGEDWTADRLERVLLGTLDLAAMRLVTLETLPLAGRVLPAIYTQSASLQGELVPDWSRLGVVDIADLVRAGGLASFAMMRED